MKTYIYLLKDADDPKIFGSKTANLAKMLQAGLPVPGGLAVGLGAFNEDGQLKPESKAAIIKLLKLKALYAVRSSALAEDAEGASWAGQFETFLNTKPDEVIARIEECHNSAKARAKAYASKQGESEQFNVAVAVQEMIQPEYAGVLFTKDPIKGKNTMEVEYVEGLGEQLVSGNVTPESFSWDRESNALGRTTQKLPFQPKKLISLALAIETLYSTPQDIEWVFVKNKFYLVQTRPITTLPEVTK